MTEKLAADASIRLIVCSRSRKRGFQAPGTRRQLGNSVGVAPSAPTIHFAAIAVVSRLLGGIVRDRCEVEGSGKPQRK